MTLAELAGLVGAPPKWVLNTTAALGGRARYSLPYARQLAVTRVLNEELGIPLRSAHATAARAITAARSQPGVVTVSPGAGSLAQIAVDVPRILAGLAVRQSALATTQSPKQRGRPASRTRDPLARAADWGLDLSLIRANLRRTPAERLRQLDGMGAFARNVRRAPTTEG